MVSRREALVWGAAVPVSGLFLASARGQVPQQMPAGQSYGEDPILACCLLIDGRKQIEICRWAQDKVKNEDVKAFAKAEVEEHEKVKAELQKLGFEYPAPPQLQQPGSQVRPGTQPQPGAQFRPGTQTTTAGQGFPGAPRMIATGRLLLPPGLAEAVQIETEVADQCISSAKTALGKKTGAKLDKMFVGAQLFCHHGELDKLQVFEKHATERMREVLHHCRPVVERQITTLEGLMTRLDEGGKPERSDG